MLNLQRRHIKDCPHLHKGAAFKRCGCPIWVMGTKDGGRIRRSLDTANWEIAAGKLLELEAGMEKEENDPGEQMTLGEAVKKFYEDCRGRKISEVSIAKYEETLEPFKEFCSQKNLNNLADVVLDHVEKFRNQLGNSALTVGKKVERLRTFFRYCVEREWIDKNPALKVKKPVVPPTKKEPFTDEQWKKVLAAIDTYPNQNSFGYDNRERVRAFIYLLRYSALRISDAVQLKKERLKDGRLFVRAAKNGNPIHLPLPPFVVASLHNVGNRSSYFFWSGNGKLKSAVADWQRSILRLFRLAGVDGSAHRFRHTLAVDLLSRRVSIENVAAILGDTEEVVRKHYAPWVKVRQDALDAAVMSIWNT